MPLIKSKYLPAHAGYGVLLLSVVLTGLSIDPVLVCAQEAVVSKAAKVDVAAPAIKLNQLGFLPNSKKMAVVPSTQEVTFSVINAQSDKVILTATMGSAADWIPAEERVKLADFSEIRDEGRYKLRVRGLPDSDEFSISPTEYVALNQAALRVFYYNRASTQLLPKHAGVYARAAGHPDMRILVHESAASRGRPAGSIISARRGWYDGGDYNKYVVGSSFAAYLLLTAFEHYPEFYEAQNVNIPESRDATPDVLNEVIWNLEWMLAMQDPEDGGVYHKLTTKAYDDFVMPNESKAPRYVVQKSVTATLDFAAVMAVASRVFANYRGAVPGMAERLQAASVKAWLWAKAHPTAIYVQPSDILTASYADDTVDDDFAWAAAELYITTKNDEYYTAMNPTNLSNSAPQWTDVRGFAWLSLAHHRSELTPLADRKLIAMRIDSLANTLLANWQESAYAVSMLTKDDFNWNSNSLVASKAMMLIQGYRLNGNRGYLEAAQSMLDYLLGRNATGYSFVTGFGAKTPMHPHHRVSESDGIEKPIPGLLIGGPQPGQQDSSKCWVEYPSKVAAKSYLDDSCSFASNSVFIRANALLVYLSGAIQVLTDQ